MKNVPLTLTASLLLLLASFLSSSAQSSAAQSSTAQRQFRFRTVVIDAGHGGKDPGCHGKTAKESQVALKVALELGNSIKKHMPDV